MPPGLDETTDWLPPARRSLQWSQLSPIKRAKPGLNCDAQGLAACRNPRKDGTALKANGRRKGCAPGAWTRLQPVACYLVPYKTIYWTIFATSLEHAGLRGGCVVDCVVDAALGAEGVASRQVLKSGSALDNSSVSR
jgi:hypothetical protein